MKMSNLNILFLSLIVLSSILFSSIILSSCKGDYSVNITGFADSQLKNTTSLNGFIKKKISGLYKVRTGKKMFGDTVVVKWSGTTMSVFARRNEAYMVLKGGSLDSSLVFEGYWRFAQSDRSGNIRLHIAYMEGAKELLQELPPGKVILSGFANEDGTSRSSISLEYIKPLKVNDGFYIVAHRGGGRNSDLLPYSENSLEIIQYAEILGANAIEIDIRLTKDKEPILYHDDNFNTRLIKGEYMVGPVENYYLYQVKNFCTLKKGEIIPTLSEALEVVIKKTNIKFVWLDIKSVEAARISIPVMNNYMKMANQRGRDLVILVGMPTREIFDFIVSGSEYETALKLCELSIDDVRKSNSKVWAPRWTLGYLTNQVEAMQSEGRKTVVWTLDEPGFIRKFINESKFDGILTNYPTLVAYEYYIKDQ